MPCGERWGWRGVKSVEVHDREALEAQALQQAKVTIAQLETETEAVSGRGALAGKARRQSRIDKLK